MTATDLASRIADLLESAEPENCLTCELIEPSAVRFYQADGTNYLIEVRQEQAVQSDLCHVCQQPISDSATAVTDGDHVYCAAHGQTKSGVNRAKQ